MIDRSEWMYHPTPLQVSARAKELLPVLWRTGEGAYVDEPHGVTVRFVAEKHGEKRGVTAYVRRDEYPTRPVQKKRRLKEGRPWTMLWLVLPIVGVGIVAAVNLR